MHLTVSVSVTHTYTHTFRSKLWVRAQVYSCKLRTLMPAPLPCTIGYLAPLLPKASSTSRHSHSRYTVMLEKPIIWEPLQKPEQRSWMSPVTLLSWKAAQPRPLPTDSLSRDVSREMSSALGQSVLQFTKRDPPAGTTGFCGSTRSWNSCPWVPGGTEGSSPGGSSVPQPTHLQAPPFKTSSCRDMMVSAFMVLQFSEEDR